MTYCIGWKYRNSIFLVADTAVTKTAGFHVSHSSFGELHQSIAGENVEESLLKITPVSPGLVITFSGDVGLAKSIIQFIKTLYASLSDINRVLLSISASLGPFSGSRIVSLIIGNHINDCARLYSWESSNPDQVIEGPDCIWSGSLPPVFAKIAPLLLQEFVSGNIPIQRILPIITSILQSLGIHNNLIKFHVGGIFAGIQLNEAGYRWQEDTTYILTDNTFSQPDFVKCFIRDNALVVRSSVGNITRVFFDYMNDQSVAIWIRKWRDAANQEIVRGNSCYYCVLNKQYPNVVVVRSKDCLPDTDYLRFNLSNNGNTLNLKVRSDLIEMIRNPVVRDKNDGSLPISFRFLDYMDYY